jgi:WD40 repeat protein
VAACGSGHGTTDADMGLLAAGYADGTVRVLDVAQLSVRSKMQLPTAVTCLAYVRHGEVLLLGDASGGLNIVDTTSLHCLDTLLVPASSSPSRPRACVQSIEVSPHAFSVDAPAEEEGGPPVPEDGEATWWLTTDSDQQLCIWRTVWAVVSAVSSAQTDDSTAHMLMPQTTMMRLIPLATFYATGFAATAAATVDDYTPPTLACFAPVDPTLVWCAAPSDDPMLLCFDWVAQHVVRTIDLLYIPTSLAVSPDGQRLAIGAMGHVVTMVDVRQLRQEVEEFEAVDRVAVQQLTGCADVVTCLAFAPDGKTLCAGTVAEVHAWHLP